MVWSTAEDMKGGGMRLLWLLVVAWWLVLLPALSVASAWLRLWWRCAADAAEAAAVMLTLRRFSGVCWGEASGEASNSSVLLLFWLALG